MWTTRVCSRGCLTAPCFHRKTTSRRSSYRYVIFAVIVISLYELRLMMNTTSDEQIAEGIVAQNLVKLTNSKVESNGYGNGQFDNDKNQYYDMQQPSKSENNDKMINEIKKKGVGMTSRINSQRASDSMNDKILRHLNHVTKYLSTALKYSRASGSTSYDGERVSIKSVIKSLNTVIEKAKLSFESTRTESNISDDSYSGQTGTIKTLAGNGRSRVTLLINCQSECTFTELETFLQIIKSREGSHGNHSPDEPSKSSPILIATSKVEILKRIFKKHMADLSLLRLVEVSVSDSFKNIYKKMLQKVTTDLVFFARSLSHLPVDLFKDEYITMLEKKSSIDVIGGTTTTTTTTTTTIWETGCYKTRMLLYQYRIIKGYDEIHPLNSLITCDYITSPFLARKKVIKQYLDNRYLEIAVSELPVFRDPDAFFTSDVFYMDLFNHLQTRHRSVKVALSVVTITKESFTLKGGGVYVTRDQVQPFMVKNQLSRYIAQDENPDNKYKENNVEFNFACGDVNINGGAYLMKTSDGIFIPKCAIDELNTLLLFSTRIFDDHGFRYELDSGSVVGQTKLSATLPWERDHDLVYKPEYFRSLAKLNDTVFKPAGYTQHERFEKLTQCLANHNMECGYMGIRSKTWRIELVGQANIGSEMYALELSETAESMNEMYTITKARQSSSPAASLSAGRAMRKSTRGQVGGQWVSTPPSPGLYTRSKYGLDVLKHQQHWADVGGINSWMSYDRVGKWIDCKRPGHHSCSNNFLADGNLIFTDVWL